jgi:PAS domain S-box-containing protein
VRKPDIEISEILNKSLEDSLYVLIYKCLNNLDTTIVNISNNAEQIIGYSADELKLNKKSFLDIVYFEDKEIFENKLNKIRLKINPSSIELPIKIEYRIACKDKTIKWVEDVFLPIRNDLGEVTEIEGYLVEIYTNKHHQVIENTLNSFQNAINNTSIVSITNKNGDIVYVNENFCIHSKYNKEELIGNNHSIVNSGKHTKSFFRILWRKIKKGEVWRGEICSKAKDGSLYWADTVITPVYNAKKEIEYYLAIRNIITDSVSYKYHLLENENILKKIIDSVNDVIYTISKEGTFLSLSHAFERITGWKVDEWIGKPFRELLHPDDFEIAFSVFNKLFNDIHVEPYELRVKIKNGGYILIEITPSTLKIKNNIVSILGIARDVGERKRNEKKLLDISQSVSVKTGVNYFSNLTTYFNNILGVPYSMIGIFDSGQNSVKTISFRAKNVEIENFEFNIIGTIFQKIIDNKKIIFPKNTQDIFPDDPILKKFNIDSCLGYTLFNQEKEVVGLIVLMDQLPIKQISEKEESIHYFINRTANEICREIAEIKVKASEEFSLGILSSLTSHLAVIKEDGEIIAVNEAWEKFSLKNDIENTGNKGVGSNYFTVCENAIKTGDLFAEKALLGIQSVLNGKKRKFSMEYPCNSTTEERWFILNVNRMFGFQKRVVIKHIDITESKKIEQKLEKNEYRYRTLIQNSQEMIFSVNSDGNFTFTNNQFNKLLKYSEKELKSKNLFDVISSETHQNCINHFQSVLSGKSNKNVSTIFITKNNKKIYAKGNSTPIVLNGKVVGTQSFFNDVTHEKITEEKLGKSDERYKYLIENINDAIIVKNKNGKIIYANSRFLDLLGYKNEDLINLNMKDYIHKTSLNTVNAYYSDFFNKIDVPEIIEYQGIHENSAIRWLEDKPSLMIENGEIIGVQTIIRDVTEIKNKELELNKVITELTNRNNEMMQFNYIVSHNLRSPIANIIGLSSLLELKDNSEDEKIEILSHIKDSSLKMNDIIKDLSLVLNTKSNLNTKKQKVYLHSVIHSIAETLENQIEQAKCKISTSISTDANEIFSIKSYLESIFFNLISNAIKYRSSKRNLKIRILAKKIENETIIKISDNGIGLDLVTNGAYVFGLYKRFNFDVEGKGLGLHMTKNQVEALGGTIKIESEIDKGTTFIITLKNDNL